MLVDHLPLAVFVFMQDDRRPHLVVNRSAAETVVVDNHAGDLQYKCGDCGIAHDFCLQVFNLEIIIRQAGKLELLKHQRTLKVAPVVRRRVAELGKALVEEFLYLFYLLGLGELKIFVNQVSYFSGIRSCQ